VVVWTPGLAAGNPLTLAPLPDFAALAGDPEELEQAVDMAWGALQEIVAPGKTVSDELKRGVLKAALKYFATHQPGSLADFAEFLADLPPEAGAGISKAPQLALQMANLLKAAMVNNKLLHQQGMALDPAILLGLGSDYGKTRVSVVNLVGLPTLGEQQQFLNQLAMALFTWIKKKPRPAGSASARAAGHRRGQRLCALSGDYPLQAEPAAPGRPSAQIRLGSHFCYPSTQEHRPQRHRQLLHPVFWPSHVSGSH
jgi:hypothetical protein